MINKKLLFSVKESIPYIKKNVLYQWIGLICNICSTACLCLFITKSDVNRYGLFFLIFGCLILRYIVNQKAIEMSYQSSHIVKETLRSRLYKKLSKIGNSYTNDWSTAEIVQLSSEGVEQLETYGVEQLETYFANYIPQFFYSLIAPLTLFIIISFMDLKAAFVLLICVPLIPMSIVFVQKFAKKLLNRYWGQYTKLGDSFLENLQGLTTLKIYEADGHYHEKMNVESENFRKITMRVLTMQLNSITVMDLVAYGGSALGIVFALNGYHSGAITMFQTLFIILISAEFFIPMRQLGSYFHIAMNGMAASDKLFTILEKDMKEKQNVTTNEYSICASNLHFGYTDQEVLHGIHFEAKKGMIGFVGESGSGKSTLLKLLMRFWDVSKGKINVDGLNIQTLNTSNLRKNEGYVTQETILFHDTIENNLRVAKPNAAMEEIEAACKKANIHEYIQSLPNGYKTMVEELGSSLSGGERQRMGLARMFLHNSKLVLLDEPTSNLDSLNEGAILKSIYEERKDKTIIFVSHRESTLSHCDRIIHMESNRVS